MKKNLLLKTIYTKTLWERRKALIFWSIGIFFYGLLIISLFPTFGDAAGYAEVVENLPPIFEAFLGELASLSTPAGFLAAEHFSLMYPIMLTVLAVSLANGSIAKEEDAGTLELVLSRPVSRTSFVLQKVAAMYTILLVVGTANFLGIIAGPYVVEVELVTSNIWWASLGGVLVAGVFAGVVLFLSALTNSRGLTSAITVLLLIVSFFINSFALVVDWLEPFQKASVFYYYNVLDTLMNGVTLSNIVVLSIVCLVFVPLAVLAFRKRDIRV